MSDPLGAGNPALRKESGSNRVESRLAGAFEEEMALAANDLASAPSKGAVSNATSGGLSPRVALSGARHGHRRATLLPLGAVCVIVLLASASLLALGVVRPSAGPTAPSASPTSVINHDPTRYDDGIPRMWQGEPVLRGQAALDHASQSTDTSPFYIAFWYGPDPGFRSCPAAGTGGTPLSCTDLSGVGDRAGVPWQPLGKALRLFGLPAFPPDGPVIARVHTHDPNWSGCLPSELVACEHLMIGEAVEWSGDAATAPHPITVEQATAAFGVPKTEMPGDCLAQQLPGLALLPFDMPGYPTDIAQKGVIAIFPSVEALAVAAPDAAARGESEAVPTGHQWDCAYNGIYSTRVYWLARANVLMGVRYDTSLGPGADPFVVEARSELQRLPAG